MRLLMLAGIGYLIWVVSSGPCDPSPVGPLKTGDPGAGQEVQPEYPDTPGLNPFSNRGWMVCTLDSDYTDSSGLTKYSVTCWIKDSTVCEVRISAEKHTEYGRVAGTSWIPCPGNRRSDSRSTFDGK